MSFGQYNFHCRLARGVTVTVCCANMSLKSSKLARGGTKLGERMLSALAATLHSFFHVSGLLGNLISAPSLPDNDFDDAGLVLLSVRFG